MIINVRCYFFLKKVKGVIGRGGKWRSCYAGGREDAVVSQALWR